jgi:prepilin signal peptidase PulO-like enzyme (type II secretory pathway)
VTSLLVFITGLIFGSFLSVVFSRLETIRPHSRRGRSAKAGRDILLGRSRCDHCHRTIAWYDNIPLVSFLWLKGRCRHCHKRIHPHHPVLELSSGLFLLAAFLAYGLTWQFAVGSLFGLVLLLIFAYDLRHQIIPNAVVVPAIGLALVVLVYQFILFRDGSVTQLTLWSPDPESYLLAGGLVGLFFLGLSVVSKGSWVGGGDIKLGALIGLLLGWPYALVAVILAYVVGSLYAAVLLLSRKASMKSLVPFGPMLVSGYLVAVFYGDVIVRWYERLVL